MSINLLNTVQQNLGYPALQKIDPNTQAVFVDDKTPAEDKFSQAAIPAVIVGAYRLVKSDEGAEFLLNTTSGAELVNKAFEGNVEGMIQSVADYAQESPAYCSSKINAIADEMLEVVKANLPEGAGIAEVKSFFDNQRNTVLLYLPPALNMGSLLDDDTLDDNTHKMEGPLSSMMQSVGKLFSSTPTNEDVEKPS